MMGMFLIKHLCLRRSSVSMYEAGKPDVGQYSCSSCICFRVPYRGCCSTSEFHVSLFELSACFYWSDSNKEQDSGWRWDRLVIGQAQLLKLYPIFWLVSG